ncbi:phosphotransferase [Haloferax sp. MBLA0076]|uniref:Phosphotransferase n=1 Tax=Haloferax litoreum TaxID=2666140 RepID=A0A6A8GIA4_9EURY|nr:MULTISPECIES: aminoglycoside phosphotransferase family protein [Haloferax]KAB1194351.1 aminoglycoside phosphotransferase family protein [Haloferax sp. CBA1148]MRX22913.1 phosphotransferase [Haloferax litoreum]
MDDVVAVLAHEFPDRTVASMTPVRRGNHKETTIVDFVDGGAVVVQLSTDEEAIHLETAVARAVGNRTSIPVPRVLTTGTIADRGYAVVERASGDELHEQFVRLDERTQQNVARTFGRGLGEIHDSFTLDGYGAVTADTGGESGVEFRAVEATDWETWFSSYVHGGIEALPPAFDSIRDALLEATESASVPENPPSRLYPWDLRPGNALVGSNGVSAVLDWGNPLAAEPALAVAKVEHLVTDWYVSDGTSLRRAFRAGYESVRPYPTVEPIYRITAVLRSAVDSAGEVTRPGYPEQTGSRAVSFHRRRLEDLL